MVLRVLSGGTLSRISPEQGCGFDPSKSLCTHGNRSGSRQKLGSRHQSQGHRIQAINVEKVYAERPRKEPRAPQSKCGTHSHR